MIIQDYGMLNLNRDPKDIVLDLLYIENQIKFYPQKTTLGKPSPLDTRPDIYWDSNTYIPLKVADSVGMAFDGSNGLEYHRIGFDEANINIIPRKLPPTNLYSILSMLNRLYGTRLTEDDLYDISIEWADDPVNIKAKPGSLVWQGEGGLKRSDTLLKVLKLNCFKEYVPA